jgi:hypothetical protein
MFDRFILQFTHVLRKLPNLPGAVSSELIGHPYLVMNGYSTFWQIAAMFLQLFRVCMNVFGIGPLFYRFSEFVLRDPFGLQMFGYNSDSMLLCFRKSNEGDTSPPLKLDADYQPDPRKARSIRRQGLFVVGRPFGCRS